MSKGTKGYKAKCCVRYPSKISLKACSVFLTTEAHLLLSVFFCLEGIWRASSWRKPPVLCSQRSQIVLYWCSHSNSKPPGKFPAYPPRQGDSSSWRDQTPAKSGAEQWIPLFQKLNYSTRDNLGSIVFDIVGWSNIKFRLSCFPAI